MKRMLMFLCLIMVLVACEQDPEEFEGRGQIIFDIAVKHPDATKAIKTGWETGDVIYIFFNNIAVSNTPVYATLTWNGTTWDSALSPNWDGTGLAENGATMSAVFFPFSSGNLTVAKSGEGYSFRSDDVFQGSESAGYPVFAYYLVAENASYTVTKKGNVTSVGGSLLMAIPDGFVQFFIEKNTACNGRYRLSVKGVRPVSCTGYNPSGIFDQDSKDYAQPMPGYAYKEGILFSGIIDQTVWGTAKERRMILFDTEAAAVSRVFNKTLASHQAVKLPNTGWSPAVSVPNKVDLGTFGENTGTPLFWADQNLGVEDERTPFGLYFAWGEIVPWQFDNLDLTWRMKEDFAQSTYSWWDGSIYMKYGVYSRYMYYFRDLESVDDAVKAFLGPGWRMPTAVEYESLLEKYIGVDSDDWGNPCHVFSGNESTLFFPFCSFVTGTNVMALINAGELETHFWASNGDCLNFPSYEDSPNVYNTPGADPFYGCAIRPVSDVAP